jgi:hypothetical protein
MVHIDRRNRGGTIRYVARYIDPAGRERSKSFTRRADAQKYLTEIEAAKLKGIWVDPKHGRTWFQDWHDEWWGSVVNLRPSTRLRDEIYLRRYVVVRFGDMPLDAIRQREVRAWVAWLLSQGLEREQDTLRLIRLGCPDLGGSSGAPPGTRTPNRCLKRALLCQLS